MCRPSLVVLRLVRLGISQAQGKPGSVADRLICWGGNQSASGRAPRGFYFSLVRVRGWLLGLPIFESFLGFRDYGVGLCRDRCSVSLKSDSLFNDGIERVEVIKMRIQD